jgi:hypothetical protein
MKTSFILIILTFLILPWSSCGKDDVGGNAAIETFVTTSPPSWTNAGGGVHRVTIEVPQLTEEVLSEGLVSIFIAFNSSTYPPRQIPYTTSVSSGDIFSVWYDAEPGEVTINYRVEPVGVSYPNLNYVRVVMVRPL